MAGRCKDNNPSMIKQILSIGLALEPKTARRQDTIIPMMNHASATYKKLGNFLVRFTEHISFSLSLSFIFSPHPDGIFIFYIRQQLYVQGDHRQRDTPFFVTQEMHFMAYALCRIMVIVPESQQPKRLGPLLSRQRSRCHYPLE